MSVKRMLPNCVKVIKPFVFVVHYIEKWFCEYSYSIPIIQKAYEKTVDAIGKLSFPYLNKILTSWYNEGIKTPEEAAEKDIKTPKTPPSVEKETSYNLNELSKRGLFIPE